MPKDRRPKTGLSPYDYIENLIDSLELLTQSINLLEEDQSLEEREYRIKLDSLLPDQDKRKGMIQIMKDHWTSSLIAHAKLFAEEGRIREVPSASDEIKRARQKGYRIGIITQAPVEYAKEVLSFLGLVDKHNEENNVVDVVVSGDMVKKPKPDPESLVLATELIIIQTAIEQTETNLRKKLTVKERVNLERSIHQDYFSIGIVVPRPVAVIGDSRLDIEAVRHYPGTGRIQKILINSRNLSSDEIRTIKPDLTINHFGELLPQLEGNVSRKKEKR